MNEIVTLAKAFSDLNRTRMIALIQKTGPLCVCELCDTLRLSQPLVSRHLRQLSQAGIVTASRKGKWKLYTINPEPSSHLVSMLMMLEEHHKSLPHLCECRELRTENN